MSHLGRAWMTRGQVIVPVVSVNATPPTLGLHPGEEIVVGCQAFDGPNGNGNQLDLRNGGYTTVWTTSDSGLTEVDVGDAGQATITAPVVQGALGVATLLVTVVGGGGAATGVLTVTVVVGPPIAAQSSAIVTGGTVGVSHSIPVDTQDIAGNPCTTGGAAVVGKVTGANTATMVTLDTQDGNYTLTYAPSVSGTDTISVFLNGVAIAGSPFTSVVSGSVATLSPANSTATVPNGTAGSFTSMSVQARDTNGVAINTGGATVVGTVSGDNAAGPFTFTDNHNGTYSGGYTPALAGGVADPDHVAITMNGTAISGSPYLTIVGAVGTGLTPNLPTGYVVPTGWDRDFNATSEGVWALSGSMSIRDASTYTPAGATAPRNPPASPNNIGEILFPAGMTLIGITPGNAFIPGATMSAQSWTRFYAAAWLQLSSNWVSHPSGVNKVLIANIGGSPKFVLSATGGSAWQFRLQNMSVDPRGGSPLLDANLASAPVTKGLWQRIEVQAIANTGGTANGVVRLWLTNYNSAGQIVSGPTKTHEYTNVGWVAATDSNLWAGFSWQPIYGGNTGGTLAATQYMWSDKTRVAGSP